MSAFEVILTPPRNKNTCRMEPREPTFVIMAPFSGKSIVQFEEVPLTKTAKRILKIMNPSVDEIHVKVSKSFKNELNLTIEWTEKSVAAKSEVELHLLWTPNSIIAGIETLHLRDNRNFHKDVIIILKSKLNQPTRDFKKFPNISSGSGNSYIKTLRLKSPTGNTKKFSKIATSSVQRQKHVEKSATIKKAPTTKTTKIALNHTNEIYFLTNKRNLPLSPLKNIQLNSKHLKEDIFSTPYDTKSSCKENISPLRSDVLELIDNINFTPIAKVPPSTAILKNIENSSNWPTPDSSIYNLEASLLHTKLRPKRLTPSEYSGSTDVPAIVVSPNTTEFTSMIITDKTFEVHQPDICEASIEESLSLPDGVILNRTTTILNNNNAHALHIIQEEEISDQQNNTYVKEVLKSSEEDLKRDIQLIASPLRKYSESMENLSKSGISKLAIQGSMPNLNEMEKVQSIEKNRYFHKTHQKRMTIIHEQVNSPEASSSLPLKIDAKSEAEKLQLQTFENFADVSCFSQMGVFCQSEILAQSSHSNLNEIGLKCSHVHTKAKHILKEKSANEICEVIKTSDEWKEINSKKRRSNKLSLSDSNSNESLIINTEQSRIKDYITISPPKKKRMANNVSYLPSSSSISFARVSNWSRFKPKKLKVISPSKSCSSHKKPIEKTVKLYDSELFVQSCINPDPFSASTTCDPFLAVTMYLDDSAVEKHQIDFKKWLNALLIIPNDLKADCNKKIDVGKLFNEVRNKDLALVPTKEEQSLIYLNNSRLESLRKAALELYFSEEIRLPCSKVAVYINKNAIRIRDDRNLHLDVVMQRNILELLLSFNPLWLRIGLEVVFGEKINLHSNNDVIGISMFIINRLFRDKLVEQKHSRAFTLTDDYGKAVKRYSLQKILFLFLFLDKAKSKHIIKHNPCLFVKNSIYKETKDILLKFSSELLANVGDIRRELKRLGYVLLHKQTYLDEFDYAFNNLAVDLRDGIRITRIMEIILLRDDLTKQLRVPATSRLQRVFNVNLALNALSEANFALKGNIAAGNIVDGHREKTLSLLWQIIYKFRAPKFHAAAKIIQKWWRRLWLRIYIKRLIEYKKEMHRTNAIIRIQSIWRGFKARKFAIAFNLERTRTAVVIQKFVRRFLAIKHYKFARRTIIRIQQKYHACIIGRLDRHKFLALKSATLLIQRCYRRILISRAVRRDALKSKITYQMKFKAIVCIQRHWRSYHNMKRKRSDFLKMREIIIKTQRKYRATFFMKSSRLAFLRLRWAAVVFQRHYRANRLMISERENYQRIQKSVKLLQVRYRARLIMKKQKELYLRIRNSIICIQRNWCAYKKMKLIRFEFISLQYYTIELQQIFRSRKIMRIERKQYLCLKKSTIFIQHRYRSLLLMRKARTEFLAEKVACLTLQRKFRAYRKMRFCRGKYQRTKAAVICIQVFYRSYLKKKVMRAKFLELCKAAVILQRAYRALRFMREAKIEFDRQKKLITIVQRIYRRKIEMRIQMQIYKQQRQLLIRLQIRFRAKLMGRKMRMQYEHQRCLLIKLQNRIRATFLMHKEHSCYLDLRQKAIKIQRYYRAYSLKRSVRENFLTKRSAAVLIQRWFRSKISVMLERSIYQRQRNMIIMIQRKWRAKLAGLLQRNIYEKKRKCIIIIQQKFKANLAMHQLRAEYLSKKNAIIVLQRYYRRRRMMLRIHNEYLSMRKLAIFIQIKFRAHRAMISERNKFLILKRYVLFIQQKFRGRKLTYEARQKFLKTRKFVSNFQAYLRGHLSRQRFRMLMAPEIIEKRRRKYAAGVIQRYWRGYRHRKTLQNPKLHKIRKNIIELKQKANIENTIKFKVRNSVQILRGRANFNELYKILSDLDRLSRFVPQLLSIEFEYISTFCYGTMAQAIRSEEDKQIIELCCRIMLNIARYNKSGKNTTFQGHGLITIAQILLRWCDKDSDIFNTLCTIIWVFAHYPEKRQILRQFMTTSEALFLVRETKKNVARKEKMKQNARKSFFQKQNVGEKQFSSRSLPSLEPDYGIVRNKPYIFISSVYAFDTVLSKLGIKAF